MNDAFDNAKADKEALAMYGESLTHALTVHQPYAWALAAGHKPVENRTWRPPLGMVGKLIGIHAGKTSASLARTPAETQRMLGLPLTPPNDLPTGALIGVARLVGVVHMAASTREDGGPRFWRHVGRSSSVGDYMPDDLSRRIEPWWRGPWGWLLEEAVLLPEPIPMRGQQGLWRLPESLTWMDEAQGNAVWANPQDLALEQWRKAREGA